MAIISLWEIIQLVIMTLVVGYILTGSVRVRPRTVYDFMNPKRFDWQEYKYSIYVTAPAIVVHELAHKFVALAYGYDAVFQMFTFGLALGVVLKLIASPFIIIAPGFVSIMNVNNDLAYRLIALAGPFVNLVLWIGSLLILKYNKNLSRKWTAIFSMTKNLNMILFFFNMIPFGPFDGAKVIFGLPG